MKLTHYRLGQALALVVSAAALFGCGAAEGDMQDIDGDPNATDDVAATDVNEGADQEEAEVDVELTLLAEAKAEDGSVVEFYEAEPGVIIISSESKFGSPDPLADFRGSDMSASELFERVTGDSAPEELLLAENREPVIQEQGEAPEMVQQEAEYAGAITPYHSAAEAQKFEDLYCGYYTQYCRLHRTGDATRTTPNRVKQAGVIVRAFNGNVDASLKYYKNGSWRNVSSITVQEDTVRQITYNYRDYGGLFPAQHQAQMRVRNADNKGFDYAFWVYDGSGVRGTGIPSWD